RHISAVAMRAGQRGIAEQVGQGVGKSLDLIERCARNRSTCADDRITGADEDLGVAIDRARSVLELADEAIVQAAKVLLLGLAQIQVAEKTPEPDRQVAQQRLLDPAEPTHEPRGQAARNSVGQQEVEVLLR